MYLRGRYEIQIVDDHGRKPSKGSNGALYSVAAPAWNVSLLAGQWQSVYARMVGKKVTIVLNGVKVVDIPRTYGLMNTHGQAVDSKGRIHTVVWHCTDISIKAAAG